MNSSNKDCLSTDAVHVYASASLKIIQVNVAKLGNEVTEAILLTNLWSERDREKMVVTINADE